MDSKYLKSFSIVTILLFTISLFSMITTEKDGFRDLREVISKVQELEKTPLNSAPDFRVVFSKAISTMRAAAGLYTVFSKKSRSNDAEKLQFIISVRLAYLLSENSVVFGNGFKRALPPSLWQCLYQSHITSPDLPPPIFSNS